MVAHVDHSSSQEVAKGQPGLQETEIDSFKNHIHVQSLYVHVE